MNDEIDIDVLVAGDGELAVFAALTKAPPPRVVDGDGMPIDELDDDEDDDDDDFGDEARDRSREARDEEDAADAAQWWRDLGKYK